MSFAITILTTVIFCLYNKHDQTRHASTGVNVYPAKYTPPPPKKKPRLSVIIADSTPATGPRIDDSIASSTKPNPTFKFSDTGKYSLEATILSAINTPINARYFTDFSFKADEFQNSFLNI